MFSICFSVLLAILYEEGEDERVVACALETGHSLLAGEHSVLDVSQRVSIHRRIVLVGAAQEGNVCIHIRREITHLCLPGLVPVRVRTARELHVQEYPVLKDDAEGIGTPVQILRLLGHIDSGASSLDGIPGLVEHRIQSLDEDGNLALIVEIGELLQTDRILVFNPRFYGRTAVIVPGIGRVHVAVLERQYGTRNGTSVDAEVRYVNLQRIHALICRIRGVVGKLGVENHVILRLVVLELDGACSEVISCTVEHSRINRGCPGRRPR